MSYLAANVDPFSWPQVTPSIDEVFRRVYADEQSVMSASEVETIALEESKRRVASGKYREFVVNHCVYAHGFTETIAQELREGMFNDKEN